MKPVAIIGAGMAGLGAARELARAGVPAVVYDRNPYHGGHAASFHDHRGFVFDDGPHISFTKDEDFRELLAESLGGGFEVIHARVNNYWRGYWIKHPVQCNLRGLPSDLVVDAIRDFVRAADVPLDDVDTYEAWLRSAYGDTIAETFPMVYGRKYHTLAAEDMTTDWLGPRLYRPDLEQVLRGALTRETDDVHYITGFRYPSRGGFVSFLDGFRRGADVRLRHEVVAIDPRRRVLRFRHGPEVQYGQLISTMPLPDLIERLPDVPPPVREAVSRLACTSCVLVNLGVGREDLSDAHWSYFYDEDICFARVHYPHRLSPANAPPGHGSIQAEVYYSDKYRPLDVPPEALIEPAIRDLTRCGVLRPEDRIVLREARLVRYANVIFDRDRAPSLETIGEYLSDVGILCAGRYGEWGYHWTDESFRSGERAARAVVAGVPVPSPA